MHNFNLSVQWSYKCKKSIHRCERVLDYKKGESLSVCQIFCGVDPGTLWPRVNGKISVKRPMIPISPTDIQIKFGGNLNRNDEFWLINEQRFRKQISRKIPKSLNLSNEVSPLTIYIDVRSENTKLDFGTNEQYQIHTSMVENSVETHIEAETIFGARYALETISQLIVFDVIRKKLLIVGDFMVEDKPAFPHRGFLLDTVRNYFSIESIKRTIGG